MTRAALFGECMVELQGERFGAMRQTFGGDTLNCAVYLARCGRAQGLRVSYATALGDDAYSRGMARAWQSEGIGLDLVRTLDGRMPGLYAISVDERGERSFDYWRGESAARSYFDAASTPLEDAADTLDALHVSGISLAIVPPAGRERLLAAMARVRARGGLVSFDDNHRARLWRDAAEARAWSERALAVADVALLSLDDQMALHAPDDEVATIRRCLALPCRDVVLKRGAAPIVLRSGADAPQHVDVEPVADVVDTTAAGDSFAGAYLAARLAGRPAAQAAREGAALAAAVIRHPGAVIPVHAMPRH